MTKKSFKLTHRPGQPPTHNTTTLPPSSSTEVEETKSTTDLESEVRVDHSRDSNGLVNRRPSRTVISSAQLHPQGSVTTRKTIEVPEDYFFRVKMHALQRRIKEKDMWAEILEEYFSNHPDPK